MSTKTKEVAGRLATCRLQQSQPPASRTVGSAWTGWFSVALVITCGLKVAGNHLTGYLTGGSGIWYPPGQASLRMTNLFVFRAFTPTTGSYWWWYAPKAEEVRAR